MTAYSISCDAGSFTMTGSGAVLSSTAMPKTTDTVELEGDWVEDVILVDVRAE